ncbi:MAG: dethiobiotin synthase [Alphaproteobacteria bacterium]|nr:dethiobiotin synthase [Alphaproteobacteria bacterium]
MSAIFVTGAGTDIGKTFVACGLVAELRRRCRAVAAFKPLVSGFDPAHAPASDPGALLAALGEPVSPANLDRIAPFRYRAALAPDMAAAAEGKSVDFDAVVAFSRRAMIAADRVIIEGVGGVMSPITERHTVIDWIAALGVPALLISGTYLGAQTHALTALAALQRRSVAVHAVVASETTGSTVSLSENMRSLARFTAPVPVVAIPRLAPGVAHPAFAALADLFCSTPTHVR